MGLKGDKKTGAADEAIALMLERLNSINSITSKKMFGGYGIFNDNAMFGIIDSVGQAFFKIDESLIPDYESRGGVQHSRMPYYSIPEEILADSNMLVEWAQRSISLNNQ